MKGDTNTTIKMRRRLRIYTIKIEFVIVTFLLILIISFPVAIAAELNLTYDDNGNLITGDGKFRVYNEFNQLIKVYNGTNVSLDWIEEYIWHPTEDRILIKKINYEAGQSPDEVVVYVNDNFVRSYKNDGSKINDSYYIKDETGILAELKMNGTENTETYDEVEKVYYHGDHLGSTSVITNQSGDLVEETFYAPYGEILAGGAASRFSYEGKEFSPYTQDYDFNFRKYDPQLGIFTQPDSLIPNLYDPQSLNRYAFERNNPYKYVDPDGKTGVVAIGLAIGLILLKDYTLEFYHGIREGATFAEYYEAGALRSGQDVGGLIPYNNPNNPNRLEFAAGLKFSLLANSFTVVQSAEEIASGSKSQYLPFTRRPDVVYPQSRLISFSPNSFGSKFFRPSTTMPLTFSSNINQAKNAFSGGGCNPAWSSCLPTPPPVNNGGGSPSSGGGSRSGCGITMSCAPRSDPRCGRIMSCA